MSRSSLTSFLTLLRLSSLPCRRCHCDLSSTLALDRAVSSSPSGTLTRDLWPAVTISTTTQGDFGGLAALERNGIFELDGTEPNFLVEFREKLGQPRWIERNTVYFFKSHTTLVIENCRRSVRFLRMNFTSLTATFKTHPRTSDKETASPATSNCGILQARF